MPQSAKELCDKWDGPSDEKARDFLVKAGFKLNNKWEWVAPSKEHICTDEEQSAAIFLIHEWDFGGIVECGCLDDENK